MRHLMLATVVASMLVGCAGTDSDVSQGASWNTEVSENGGPVGGGGAGSSSGEEVDAAAVERAVEVLALPEGERDQVLAEVGMELELDVASESGLEAALGGREATREALQAAWAPLVTQARGVGGLTATGLSTQGVRREGSPAPGVPAIGEGLFGALMVISLGADSYITDEIPAGPPVSADKGTADMAVVVSAAQNSTSLSINMSHTDSTTGVTTKIETQTTVVPCPDPNGSFDASGLMDVTVTKGDAGQHGTLDVQIVGQVDDDARLVSSDMEYTMQWSQAGGGSNTLADVSVKLPASGEVSVTVNRTEGSGGSDLAAGSVQGGMLYALMVKMALERAAQKGWESGRCVRLDVSPGPRTTDLEPGSTVDISAAPRSKIDGGPTGGTVMATLASGGSGVDPSLTPLPADAAFVYTAHQEPDNSGVVKLEARSRRGVARAELSFETRRPAAFQIVGGLDDFQVNEKVCDVMKPFQLRGGGVTAAFSGGLSGTYSYTGPFNATGGGTYSISLPNGPSEPGSMVGEGSGTVDTPLGTFGASGTETYVLTPLTNCIDNGDEE